MKWWQIVKNIGLQILIFVGMFVVAYKLFGLLAAAIIVADVLFGLYVAAPAYVKKLDKLEKELQKQRSGEYLEFPFLKGLIWNLGIVPLWWAIFPYEWLTHWRQWTYPYCLPRGAPERRYWRTLRQNVNKSAKRLKKFEDDLEIEPQVFVEER